MYKLYWAGLLIAFVFSCSVFAQESHIRFKRITIDDGLSLSSIYCIYQDRMGFMWLGTEDGLNKYDGRKFTVYRSDPLNENSLAYKWIELINEDHLGQLWLGSRGGLTCFNPQTEQFTQFKKASARGLTNDTITAICPVGDSCVWVGTINGLNRININQLRVQALKAGNNGTAPPNGKIHFLQADTLGNLWIGASTGLHYYNETAAGFTPIQLNTHLSPSSTQVLAMIQDQTSWWVGTEQGLLQYFPETGKVVRQPVCDAQGRELDEQRITKLYMDKQGVLWVLHSQGLYRFITTTSKFELVIRSLDSSHSLAINSSELLHVDCNGLLWYGTFGDGLYRIDPGSGRMGHFTHDPANPLSLSQNALNCIYEDRSGAVWAGTFGAGVSIYIPQSHKFNLYRHDPLNPNSLSSNFIWAICQGRDGKVWVGTNDHGLDCYSPSSGRYTHYEHRAAEPASLAASSVRALFEDQEGNLWVGTDGGGLDRFNRKAGTFQHFKHNPDNAASLSGNSIRVITQDASGDLWIGTRNGLNRYRPSTGVFTRYLHDPDNLQSLSNNFVYSAIYPDQKGNLWIGTYGGGLNKMDLETAKFTSYQHSDTDLNTLSDNIVFSIYETPDGMLWIGTNHGLNRFDPDTERFQSFGMRNGLPNEVIYGILPDDDGHLWLSTNFGLCRFHPKTFQYTNYDVTDGLQSNEFNGGAFHKGPDGQMYFGGVYGLNSFRPEQMVPTPNLARMAITQLEIMGRPVHVHASAKKPDSKIPAALPLHIAYTKRIDLDYSQRYFSIEFAALNCLQQTKQRFSYQLSPLDQTWNSAGSRNYVTYANLKPGDYTFRVKSYNMDGKESLTTASLQIGVVPPFWKKRWFYLIEFLVLLLLIGFVYRYLLKVKTNKLLRIQNQKIREANQQLTQSEQKLRALNATKDKFFSIIAHDLRNPFASMLSLSELMSKRFDTLDEEDKISGIRGFNNSARRLYNLLENLLTWSRSQTGRIDFHPEPFNLSHLIQECIHLYSLSAEKKGIQVDFSQVDKHMAYGDQQMISTVIRNLLSNAIKFSRCNGAVEIEVVLNNLLYEITVRDSGVGIAPAHLKKLFRIESTRKCIGTSGEKGSGLGLLICKEFVERNGGTISVKSKLDKGSEFCFTLPISK